MIYIIGILLVVAIGYLFVVYVLPVLMAAAGVIALVIAGIAVLVGSFLAIWNYCKAIHQEMNFRTWTWERGTEPARRSYFFGPGYVQLGRTVKTAFSLNAESGATVIGGSMLIRGTSTGILGFLRLIPALIFGIVGCVCVFVVGTALCLVLALLHCSVTTAIMLLVYVIFSIVWLIDRLYLRKNRIRSDCPNCHHHFLIPDFTCPDCGAVHHRLVPGPYGIWHHRCTCGRKLPSTFFNGRSNLDSFCPDCGAAIAASNARPVVLQLIGGSNAGKTVYLSAFFHIFREKLQQKGVAVSITEEYQPLFDELDRWFDGEDCPSTAQLNSQMYPLFIDELGIRRQFSLYDIAGEMFTGATSEQEILQQQFTYCDGILFLLDPFSSGSLREERLRTGGDVSDFSDILSEDVVSSFINYLIRTGHIKANTRCDIPLAVLISKSDFREVKGRIGPAKLNSILKKNPDTYENLSQARDGECRSFLVDIGLSAAVETLEAQFSNVHYFPVSAIGHSPDGSEYEPWGVEAPVEWILPLADQELAEVLLVPEAVKQKGRSKEWHWRKS